jgi:orotate phosphoribosyltransferase
MRNLIVAYRLVPEERAEDYDRIWLSLEEAARSCELRAWRFRSLGAGDEFVEFIEGVGVERNAPFPVEAIRRSLDRIAPAVSDRSWQEAPPAAEPQPAGDRAALLALLRERSLRRGAFVLASGAHSNYYIDARPTTMSATGQRLIGRLGLAELARQGWVPTAIGGLTLGADPVAYAIAHASALAERSIDAFTVRKQAKAHGAGRRVEGNLGRTDAAVIVEDVMTSGKSALEALAAVREEGARVIGVLTLVDREAGGGERLTEVGVAVAALFTARELLEE